MALLLNGKKKNIKLRDFEALAAVLAIPEEVRAGIYKKFTSRNTEVFEMINASFLSTRLKENYWEIWNKKQQIFE